MGGGVNRKEPTLCINQRSFSYFSYLSCSAILAIQPVEEVEK